MPRRPVVVLAVVIVLSLLGALAAPAPAAEASDGSPVVAYRPPVDAPIVDHFDPPEKRWQAGNRGIDYGVASGTAVGAAADGEVVFAGPVADALHVTVVHADGLRTSYSFLAEVDVHVGQKVRAGQTVGLAGGPVHVGVRTPDGTYLDPEALFAGALEPHVRLVPGAEEGLDPLVERRSLLDTLLDVGAGAAAHLRDTGVGWLRLVAHYAAELDPVVHLERAAGALQDWLDQLLDCTPASTPPPSPKGRRIVVLVSGLGTASDGNSAWEFDTATMGYADVDVVRFSYQGGQAPPLAPADGSGDPVAGAPSEAGPEGGASRVATAAAADGAPTGLAAIPVRPFTDRDSQQSVELSARRLEALLAEVARAEPGVPIDVLAHSQGGVVARLGVVEAGAAGTLPPTVENLVTVGAPHQGAPLATGVDALSQTTTGREVLAVVKDSGAADGLDDQLPAMTDLSEVSDTIGRMQALPVPDGVRFTSLGGSGDLIVPGTATDDAKADTHRLIPTPISKSAHGDITRMPETTREVRLAVAGAGPTCQSFGEAMGSFGEAEVIRTGESGAVAGLALSTVAVDRTAPPPELVTSFRD